MAKIELTPEQIDLLIKGKSENEKKLEKQLLKVQTTLKGLLKEIELLLPPKVPTIQRESSIDTEKLINAYVDFGGDLDKIKTELGLDTKRGLSIKIKSLIKNKEIIEKPKTNPKEGIAERKGNR